MIIDNSTHHIPSVYSLLRLSTSGFKNDCMFGVPFSQLSRTGIRYFLLYLLYKRELTLIRLNFAHIHPIHQPNLGDFAP